MDEQANKSGKEELDAWIKKHRDAAVRNLMKHGVINSLLLEAKPTWVLPFQILIGKVRAQDQSTEFKWFICGEVPTDYLHSSIASTPRDTARHFAMKWQLAAAKFQEERAQESTDEGTDTVQTQDPAIHLIDHAEALYALVEDDRLWLPQEN